MVRNQSRDLETFRVFAKQAVRLKPFGQEQIEVSANRDLMMAKVKIAREFGLIPLVYAKSTHFIPEAFFREQPQLRGPRVDHPRRSKKEAFTWCADLPETRDYIHSHGGRLTGTRKWQDAAFIQGLEDLKWAANTLGKLGDAPAYD